MYKCSRALLVVRDLPIWDRPASRDRHSLRIRRVINAPRRSLRQGKRDENLHDHTITHPLTITYPFQLNLHLLPLTIFSVICVGNLSGRIPSESNEHE